MDNPPAHRSSLWTALRVRGLTTAGTTLPRGQQARTQAQGLCTAAARFASCPPDKLATTTIFLFFLGDNSRGARTRSERGGAAPGGPGGDSPAVGGYFRPLWGAIDTPVNSQFVRIGAPKVKRHAPHVPKNKRGNRPELVICPNRNTVLAYA